MPQKNKNILCVMYGIWRAEKGGESKKQMGDKERSSNACMVHPSIKKISTGGGQWVPLVYPTV